MPSTNTQTVTSTISVVAPVGIVYSLVVISRVGGEPDDIWSFIYQGTTNRENEESIIYEVRAWLTSLCISASGDLFAPDTDGQMHSYHDGTWSVRDWG